MAPSDGLKYYEADSYEAPDEACSRGGAMVKANGYEAEGHEFDSR